MNQRIITLLLIVLTLVSSASTAAAREGDTLEPVRVEAAPLVTYPDTLLSEDNFRSIEGRVVESRNAGAPVAVRIVDLSLPQSDLPFQIRQFLTTDFSQPVPQARQDLIVESWLKSEPIESSEGANDGFLLLVLVPEDRSQTLALWSIGDNALPLNGLTRTNIEATHGVMDPQLASGNVPNGVFLAMSEFGYNVQFGTPERLQLSKLGSALHTAVLPLAIGTILAGIAIPLMAWWVGRTRSIQTGSHSLSPWHAAALHRGRATADIPAAMLLDAYHHGELQPHANGTFTIAHASTNPALNVLHAHADESGTVPAMDMLHINAITEPVERSIEHELVFAGYFAGGRITERAWMLAVMAVALFMAVLSVVPSVVGLSRIGIFACVFTSLCVMFGWWWLRNRKFTTDAGEQALTAWLDRASAADLARFETAIDQTLLTDTIGGPGVANQTRLIRTLRGLGAG